MPELAFILMILGCIWVIVALGAQAEEKQMRHQTRTKIKEPQE